MKNETFGIKLLVVGVFFPLLFVYRVCSRCYLQHDSLRIQGFFFFFGHKCNIDLLRCEFATVLCKSANRGKMCLIEKKCAESV